MATSKKRTEIEKDKNGEYYVKPPTFFEMVQNFKASASAFLKGGAEVVDTKVYINRLGKCNDCEHLRRKTMRCNACGCLLQAKARMETGYCPLGKWENGEQPRPEPQDVKK